MVKVRCITTDDYKRTSSMFKVIYSFHSSPFGKCLIAITNADKAVVYLGFVDGTEANALKALKSKWPISEILEDTENEMQDIIETIFRIDTFPFDSVSVLLKGTEFQIKVWKSLTTISTGISVTYEEVARMIENPKAIRAVGSAISKNCIAYIIPCHRVKGKNGSNKYAWGVERKEAMLNYEKKMVNIKD